MSETNYKVSNLDYSKKWIQGVAYAIPISIRKVSPEVMTTHLMLKKKH